MNKYPSKVGADRGFTLVELLVSMATLIGLMAMLVSLSSQTGRLWSEGDSRNQQRSNGRALLQFIARELRMSAIPASSSQLISAGATVPPANLQMIANLPDDSDCDTVIPAGLLNPHGIFWQVPTGREGGRGDIACVGYFIRWNTPQPGVAQPELCRYYVDSSDAANYLIYNNDSGKPVNWLSNISTIAPGSPGNYKGWFADNVIALWVRVLDASGNPITTTADGQKFNGGYGFDSRLGFTDSNGVVHPAPALPPVVEIALVTIETSAAQQIAAPIAASSAGPETFYQDIQSFLSGLPEGIRRGAQCYSTKVYLQTSLP